MEQATTIGLDIAKRVFQVHGADGAGRVLFRKRSTRVELLSFLATQTRCVVAMEACAGAHYWAREIAKLGNNILDSVGWNAYTPAYDDRTPNPHRSHPVFRRSGHHSPHNGRVALAKRRLLPNMRPHRSAFHRYAAALGMQREASAPAVLGQGRNDLRG